MSWDELVAKIDAEIERGIADGEEGAAEAKVRMEFLKGIYDEIMAEDAN